MNNQGPLDSHNATVLLVRRALVKLGPMNDSVAGKVQGAAGPGRAKSTSADAPPQAESTSRVPLLVIGGPTAVGKTQLAMRVAEAVPAEVVSADAMAVYQGMDVGTAKPTAEERRRVRFHLIDHVPPEESYSLSRFLREAEGAIESIHARGRLPILCGGTGLYVRALLHGFNLPPGGGGKGVELRRRLEARLAEAGLEALVAELTVADPTATEQVDLRNPRRVMRALEIVLLSGLPLARARARGAERAKRYMSTIYGILCPRRLLYHRIDERVERMIQAGWLEETRRLMVRLRPESTALQAIGYRELAAYLRGETNLAKALARIKHNTRRYAKRQITWWKREEGLRWLGWETPQDFSIVEALLVREARHLFVGEDLA